MDGLQDGTQQIGEGAAQRQPEPQDGQAQQAEAQVEPDGAAKARADYEAALKERDARIAELEGEIAQAAKTAESAEKLRAEMDELQRQGDEQRVGFELQLAGARNVKAARALLPDYDDVEKLRAGEPWLFGAGFARACAVGRDGAAERGSRHRRGRADEALAQDRRHRGRQGVAGR